MTSPALPSPGGEDLRLERRIVLLVGAVQFVSILDFMIVMPLGPDFAAGLGISNAQLGVVGGSYTAAAAVAGMIASLFLDRFGRRAALSVAMTGLVLATAAGGLASGLGTLVAARVLAGVFGGPAMSLGLSIIADVIPPARRGRAMGAVMGAFSAASVMGVPAGLWLSRHGGWRLPFFAVAGLGAVVGAAALFLMPALRGHVAAARRHARPGATRAMLRRRPVLLALGANATTMMAGFAIIPNLAAYLQHNLRYPRAGLELLYFVGGLVSFGVMRLAGALVDRRGAMLAASLGTGLLVAILLAGFVFPGLGVPVIVLFVGFMVAMSFRNVTLNTVSSRIPAAPERARFMSAQSAVQHLSAAMGAFAAAQLLDERPGGALVGMPRVALFAAALVLMLPLLLLAIERSLVNQDPESGGA